MTHLDAWERQPQPSLLIDAPMPRVVPCANSIVYRVECMTPVEQIFFSKVQFTMSSPSPVPSASVLWWMS